jgi:glycosyltransferase involved in cell wall biosynthesis
MGKVRTPTVAVVIPCFEQKRFLAGAIASAVRQSVLPSEIIVVDDGSSEDLSTIVAAYGGARLLRQSNRGLAGARNTGLKAATSDKIVFLDADDRLLPEAIQSGLGCFRDHPEAAFVYGHFWVVRGRERSLGGRRVSTHRDLVRCNWVGMIASAMFDRRKLLDEGGFEESLGMCEDWDAYLRLARRYSFAAYDTPVADYVKHGANASNDLPRLRKWIEIVRAREWNRGLDPDGQLAWHEGEQVWREMLDIDPKPRSPVRNALTRLKRAFSRPRS